MTEEQKEDNYLEEFDQELHLRLVTKGACFFNEIQERNGDKWNIAMAGFRVGDPANENGYVFTEKGSENWLREFSHSPPGRDGHTRDQSYGCLLYTSPSPRE